MLLRELLIGLLGEEWRRRLVNKDKPTGQLFPEYLDIIAASKSPKWHYETRLHNVLPGDQACSEAKESSASGS